MVSKLGVGQLRSQPSGVGYNGEQGSAGMDTDLSTNMPHSTVFIWDRSSSITTLITWERKERRWHELHGVSDEPIRLKLVQTAAGGTATSTRRSGHGPDYHEVCGPRQHLPARSRRNTRLSMASTRCSASNWSATASRLPRCVDAAAARAPAPPPAFVVDPSAPVLVGTVGGAGGGVRTPTGRRGWWRSRPRRSPSSGGRTASASTGRGPWS